MTQEQAVIALRDAAEDGGTYQIDTDKSRHVGVVSRTQVPRLTSRGTLWFRLHPRDEKGYTKSIRDERVLAVKKVRGPA